MYQHLRAVLEEHLDFGLLDDPGDADAKRGMLHDVTGSVLVHSR